jgi:hypothetical protein
MNAIDRRIAAIEAMIGPPPPATAERDEFAQLGIDISQVSVADLMRCEAMLKAWPRDETVPMAAIWGALVVIR